MKQSSVLAQRSSENLSDCATDYDAVDLSSADYRPEKPFRAVYVGGEGDLIIASPVSGKRVTFTGVQPGIYPLAGRAIVKDGTTATDLVALF